MRLIDADALTEILSTIMSRYLGQGRVKAAKDCNWAITVLQGAPTMQDAVIVTRCKNCIYRIDGLCFSRRSLKSAVAVEPEDFCAWGTTE